jgi:hypothetical protein
MLQQQSKNTLDALSLNGYFKILSDKEPEIYNMTLDQLKKSKTATAQNLYNNITHYLTLGGVDLAKEGATKVADLQVKVVAIAEKHSFENHKASEAQANLQVAQVKHQGNLNDTSNIMESLTDPLFKSVAFTNKVQNSNKIGTTTVCKSQEVSIG